MSIRNCAADFRKKKYLSWHNKNWNKYGEQSLVKLLMTTAFCDKKLNNCLLFYYSHVYQAG